MAGVRVAVGVIVLLLVAGCAGVGEQPAPAGPAGGASASASAPVPAVPARPRDVPIDGVDPCTLLTEEQRAGLGLDQRPVLDRRTSTLYGTPVAICATRGFEPRAVTVGVTLARKTGIEFFTSGSLAVDISAIRVAEYPAVLALRPDRPEFCSVVVDVAPGQLVEIQFRDGGREPPVPQEELCRDVQQTAELVMDNLLSQR